MSYLYYCIIGFEAPCHEIEIILKDLYVHRCLGVERHPSTPDKEWIRAYFEDDDKTRSYLSDLIQRYQLGPHVQITPIGLPQQQETSTYFEPLQLVEDFWLCPVHSASKTESVLPQTAQSIRLQLGPAFGTGRHPTTQLCAQLLAEISPIPKSLLDVGTGSGVLALLAKKLGIARVDGVEISAEARVIAEKNFALNDCSEIQIYPDLSAVETTYDIIVANLLTPTLLHLQHELIRRLKPGGRLIFSGIHRGEIGFIRKAFATLVEEKSRQTDDWWAIQFLKRDFS